MKYSVRHICEYVLLRALTAWFCILPYRVALLSAWSIGFFFHHVLRFRVRNAMERLDEVFGDTISRSRKRRIAWISWRNFIFASVDTVRLLVANPEKLRSRVVDLDRNTEGLRRHFAGGVGGVLACAHTGSWDLTGVLMQIIGVPVFFVTGRQNNPLVDAFLNHLRSATGVTSIPRGSMLLRNVIRNLRHGQALGIMPDVRSPTESLAIRFLGKEANVPAGTAMFARQANVPVFTVVPIRIGWMRHRIVVFDPIWPDQSLPKQDDWKRMTQTSFSQIENMLRQYPEQWFWYNKRWILQPLDPDEGKTPSVDEEQADGTPSEKPTG